MSLLVLVTGFAAAAPSVGAHGELRGRSAGLVDGMAVDLRVPVARRVSVQAGGMVRLSPLAWDDHWEDAWLRASELGTLDPRGSLPIAADVWSADALVGVRVVDGPVALHVQGGASVRGQAAALFLRDPRSASSDPEAFTVRTDAWDGAVRVRPLNPVVGLAVTLPVSPVAAVELGLQQVFPIGDPVLAAQPGFTVVRVGARVGRPASSGASAGDDPSGGPPGIRALGVPSLDDFFAQVDGLHTELERLESGLEAARRGLERAAQLQGLSVEAFLAEVRAGAIDLGLVVQVREGRPEVAVRTDLTGDLGEAAEAVRAVGDVAAEVAAAVPALVERARALVEAAQALARSGPADVKAAGLAPMQVPEVLGDLRHNVQVTTQLPESLAATLAASTSLLASLGAP